MTREQDAACDAARARERMRVDASRMEAGALRIHAVSSVQDAGDPCPATALTAAPDMLAASPSALRFPGKTLVVKVGSSTLVGLDGALDEAYLRSIACQVRQLRDEGCAVVVVSSGAIACGLGKLGIDERPQDLPTLQAAASVGQNTLASCWDEALAAEGVVSSLVLLTRRDTADRTAYLNARATLARLLELGVVPIVNENDTVSVEQIRFGDNDTLAALVACLIEADLCVILSDIEGFFDADPAREPNARLVPRIDAIDHAVVAAAGAAGTKLGSGGMVTKVRAARVLATAGIPLVVCAGRRERAIVDASHGLSVGTLFAAARKPRQIAPRKLWIALGDAARGRVVVDKGAKEALASRGASLLVVGVTAVEGDFSSGDVVDVVDGAGTVIARGLAGADRDAVALAVGKSREELAGNALLAELSRRALVHRDDLIVFD